MVATYYKSADLKKDLRKRVIHDDGAGESQDADGGPVIQLNSEGTQPAADPRAEGKQPAVGVNNQDQTYDPRENARDRITSSEIRLLRLYPGHFEDPLVANIEVYTLPFGLFADEEDQSDEPKMPVKTIAKKMPAGFKYEALSYTWGGSKKVGAIQILEDNKRFEIRIGQNLMSALRRLRRPPRFKSRDSGHKFMRGTAKEYPHIAYDQIRKAHHQGSDEMTALDYLCIILPGMATNKLEAIIEGVRACKAKSPEEKDMIRQLTELLRSNPDQDEDDSLVRYLWIDAICIDQDDHDEKSRQIPRMSDIYMRATNVCVWLGELDEQTDSKYWHTDSSLAMDFVDEVVNNWDDIEKLTTDKEQEWSSFISLIRRPWFSRRWIVQEITRAKQATLYCGKKEVEWDKFADVVSLLRQYQPTLQDIFKRSVQLGNDPEGMGDLDELSAIRLVHASDHLFRRDIKQRISEKLLPLEGLMSTLTAFEASEPKDVVYAIVWLAHDAVPVSKDAFMLSSKLVSEGERVQIQVARSRQGSPIPSPFRRLSHPSTSTDLDVDHLDTRLNNLADSKAETSLNGIPKISQPEFGLNGTTPAALARPAGQRRPSVFGAQLGDKPRDEKMGKTEAKPAEVVNGMQVANFRGTNLSLQEFLQRYTSLRNLMMMLKYKRFIINYEKSLFDICYDFLRFCVDRSGRLDLLGRPWAPEPCEEELRDYGQLPTWIRRTSQHGPFSKLHGGPMERINADPLVGRPGTNEKRFYTADRGIRATFKTIWDKDQPRAQRQTGIERPIQNEETERDWNIVSITQDYMKMETPKDEYEAKLIGDRKRSLLVRGFVIDSISNVHPAAIGGTIPVEWLKAANWTDAMRDPPEESFWRLLVGNRNSSGDRAPASWKRACHEVFKKRAPGSDLNVRRQLIQSHLSLPTRQFLKRVESMVFRRSLLELRYDDMKREKEEKEKQEKREKAEQQREKAEQQRLEVPPHAQSFPSTPKRSVSWSPRLTPTTTFTVQKSREEEARAAKEDKKLALGPCDAQAGDIIAIILGCSVPVVLRKVEKDPSPDKPPWSWRPVDYDFQLPRTRPKQPEKETEEQWKKRKAQELEDMRREEERLEPERFQLIGECYVHEKMDGEAWKEPNIWCEIRQFTIV